MGPEVADFKVGDRAVGGIGKAMASPTTAALLWDWRANGNRKGFLCPLLRSTSRAEKTRYFGLQANRTIPSLTLGYFLRRSGSCPGKARSEGRARPFTVSSPLTISLRSTITPPGIISSRFA